MTNRHDTKHGCMKLANTLLEDMAAMDLTGCEFRVVFWVWRNSYAYSRKQTEQATMRDISKATRLNPGTVCKAINSLQRREIIVSGNGRYKFNKYAVSLLPVGNKKKKPSPFLIGNLLPTGNKKKPALLPVGNTVACRQQAFPVGNTNETMNKSFLKREEKRRGGGECTNIFIKGTPPRPVPASPSITEDSPKAAVMALAGHYCTVRGLVFVNDAARAVTLRSRAVYYPAADLLTKAGGDSALAQRAINDHAAHYREKGFDAWDLRSVRDDFDKWNTERSKYE